MVFSERLFIEWSLDPQGVPLDPKTMEKREVLITPNK